MAKLGYARISTGDQTLDLQRDALRQEGCVDVYEEQISGSIVMRPVLAQVLRALRPGDCLVVWRLDRLGRNVRHLLEIVEDLQQRGIGLRTLTGHVIDTTTPEGRLSLLLFAALAEYERALIQERIHAGLRAARARGRVGGRKPKFDEKQQRAIKDMAQVMPITDVAKTLGCSRGTIYRVIAPLVRQA